MMEVLLRVCFKIQDKPKFNKRFSNQASGNVSKARKDRVSNPRIQGKKVVVFQVRSHKVTNVAKSMPTSV